MLKVEELHKVSERPRAECAIQIWTTANIATKEEIEAVGGPYVLSGNPPDVEAITNVCTSDAGMAPDVWEINVWGVEPTAVEARAALVVDFLKSKEVA